MEPMRSEITLTQKMRFGPAMSALTERRRSFVVALNNAGGKNATEAARAAGYLDSGSGSIRVTANHLLHDPNVQAAIIEDAKARLVGDIHATLLGIDEIAGDPSHKDRLKALTTKLHHAGMIEKTIQQMEVSVNVTYEQKVDELKRLAIATGRDPVKYLAEKGITITDAEFEEVAPTNDIPGLEGLV